MSNLSTLKPCKKGETHNPNGRPKKIVTQIAAIPADAQLKTYAVLHEAIHADDKDEAAKILTRGADELPEYGFILQLARKELLGRNGWAALNDILDRLFGKAKIITDTTLKVPGEGLAISFVKKEEGDKKNDSD